MKIIKSFFGMAALMLALFTISCSSTDSYQDTDAMVSAAAKNVEFITVEALMAKVDSGDMFNLIDVREPNEYNHGYIPGAINIPRGVLEFKINNEQFWTNEGLYLPLKDEEFILVCKKGSRSILAARSIMKLGYENVKVLKGGWKKWELTYPDVQEKNLDAGAHEQEEEVGGC
jgi:rhodanese-related sulfurtransferase